MSEQQTAELYTSAAEEDELAQFCASLQPLPSVLRYYDEFDDTARSIRAPAEENVFELYSHGRSSKIDFRRRNPHCALILKHTHHFQIIGQNRPRHIRPIFRDERHRTRRDAEPYDQPEEFR